MPVSTSLMRTRLDVRGGAAGMRPVQIWSAGRELALRDADWPVVGRAAPGRRLEIEIGFGKGRYLLRRAAALPGAEFVGIESAPTYWRLASARAERRGLRNLTTICGDALYLLATSIEPAVADAMHVYFPDPWPKLRHRKRRLLDDATVDLVIGALVPGGSLYFATDHLEYGEVAHDVLTRHPALVVQRVEGPWPDGARTNYETKYEREGRRILRLIARRRAGAGLRVVHPDGRRDVVAGC
jgi:tRNA (guanine-N7-)-methyltransferase